jgi:hypothetical protein
VQGSSSKHTVGPAVDLLAGALSLAVATKLWTQCRPAPPRRGQEHASLMNRPLARGAGAACGSPLPKAEAIPHESGERSQGGTLFTRFGGCARATGAHTVVAR